MHVRTLQMLLVLLALPAPAAGQGRAAYGLADSLAIAAADLDLHAAPASGSVRTARLAVGTPALVVVATPDTRWMLLRTHRGEGWAQTESLIGMDRLDPGAAWVELAERWLDAPDAGFAQLTGVVDAMTLRVATLDPASKHAVRVEFLRLQLLQRALDIYVEAHSWHTSVRDPALLWVLLHEDQLAYGEPQGAWYVRRERLRILHGRATDPALADAIAWWAAEQPVPGECEGYLPCVLAVMRDTDLEYLARHPQGARAANALARVAHTLERILEDATAEFGHDELCEESVQPGVLAGFRTLIARAPEGDSRTDALRAIDALTRSCETGT